ncbi:MAG: hypothetical protein EOP50_06450 [Sphingobacteriales bacterium]|nr:MAG: hypothetical protein EOP50_06450 [Sphingobacteriales bacterium]
MNRSVRLGQKVQRLLSLAGQLHPPSAASADRWQRLLDAGNDTKDFIPGASCLNNDGAPLQLCLTSSTKGVALRVIGDPGAQHGCPEMRYDSSLHTLRHFVEASGSGALKDVAEKTIAALLPPTPTGRAAYKQGFAWIGVSPEQPGIAFYLEMAPLGRSKGWDAVKNWLTAILPQTGNAMAIVQQLQKHCIVASAGLEGSTPENTRAKIYFRISDQTAIADLGIDLLASDAMQEFLSIATAQYEVDGQGLVMSVGFNLQTGALVDAKADLCGHCLRYTTSEWNAVIGKVTNQFSLTSIDTNPILGSGEYAVAFIGFGLTTDGKPRLNVYVKHDVQTGLPESDEISGALKDAMRYLLAMQNENGSWTDYQLPVGASDQWVTAYAALSLAQYGLRSGNSEALDAAHKAASWLATNRSYTAGWGYHGRTGPDADSTAMAVALFDELLLPVADADRSFLRDSWRAGDCIATYSAPGAWATGHWDVTPWGYHGLSHGDRLELFDEFQNALHTQRMNNGLWRSYWWRNPYYSTFVTLEVLDRLGVPEPEDAWEAPSITIDNAFDLACYIGIECIRDPSDPNIGAHIRALLNWQWGNGQWPGAANLRVTDNTCYEPWNNPSGAYYNDGNGILTTATALRVLAKILPSNAPGGSGNVYHWM